MYYARLVLVGAAALWLSGCISSFARGKDDFRAGRYGEARVRLESLETTQQAWDAADRAQYALIRGLTHQALGDTERARLWLYRAKTTSDADADALSAVDHERLRVALESLGEGPHTEP